MSDRKIIDIVNKERQLEEKEVKKSSDNNGAGIGWIVFVVFVVFVVLGIFS
ncbi:hypothetical protein QNZ88_001163 [Vibrio parahaemolyticus]|uniref:hypothetical protein n=1 Tax=Vibrio parahaemolyticus TaxID=670 RepID=UPI0022699B75|nr:hypothetical protein [Vibrio parahaemolyticus]ELB2154343.1 hypothetical protein [Vibrio parahaemolyticus]MCX8892240.1 hypothetical protein [Vibrio parahaemolyticus]